MEMLSKLLNYLKRFWKFLGEDSLASWVANVVVAFIVIYFIVYPLFGFLFSTSLPIVAVVSSSMEHNSYNLNDWWAIKENEYKRYNITKEDFAKFKFKNGFNKGDIMVVYGVEPKDIKVGDVIIYRSTINANPIIHRVVSIQDDAYVTKGDNNQVKDQNLVSPSQVEDTGKAVLRIPFLGWIKITFTNFITSLRS
ncbi:MAG: signal peptidase I [Candidatus Nanoarchaeia archaeon]|nr:signal peptidase I [Candidatus Nanoarchaeia archaeon]